MLSRFFSGKSQIIKPSATALVYEEAQRLKVPFDFSVGQPVFFPVFDQVDSGGLEAVVKKNEIKIIVLNNPTGFVWDEASLLGLGEIAIKHDCLVVSDEVYDQFVYESNHVLIKEISFVSLVRLFKDERWRFITVNSFSKTFCMMGHRVGYVLAEKELVGKLAAIQSQSSCT